MTRGPIFTRRQLLAARPRRARRLRSARPALRPAGRVDAVNERAQQRLFRGGKRARLVPARALTPLDDFPRYYISPSVPTAPAGWQLAVGGLVGSRCGWTWML